MSQVLAILEDSRAVSQTAVTQVHVTLQTLLINVLSRKRNTDTRHVYKVTLV